ncbi:cation diffusion facilitator family transporter [Brevibacterium jeotgali]|uniref:Cation diffusion facilitator family transporter n=1 Tax=Brevibacterium jeotgali TaxID=1262550 RepID=A0A2H1L2C5_9MICO|nr:cation transporter [Brevibacterium jeotgali]TWC03041.1 cation diffusion facilitator family transporter [Brevibacterium jeotgali]SMY11064.1 cation diffusion facilitator family transporter [Brevibacterium jeotgali]
MRPRFGHTELPEEQAHALAKAIRLERITLLVTVGTITLVLLVAGSSQAMKAAWIEDSLALLPPLAFLIAARFIRRRPTARRPYGYHRAIGVAHLVSGVALLVMGLYLIVDSGHGLVAGDHPPIGVMVVFGTPIWQGWLMVGVMSVVAVPPIILGRMKLKLAPLLHDKVLYADAQMNKADWMTALATIAGVLGIGMGLWWADGAAAILVSVDIIRDGWNNLRDAVRDLMDSRATTHDGAGPDPLPQDVVNTLLAATWVDEAEARARDLGHVLHIEAFVVPVDGGLPPLAEVTALRERCIGLDWRIQDLVLSVVEELPDELLPQLNGAGPHDE